MLLVAQMDGVGGGLFVMIGAMLAVLLYFVAYINFHLAVTKMTGRMNPTRLTRVAAHLTALTTALLTFGASIVIEGAVQ